VVSELPGQSRVVVNRCSGLTPEGCGDGTHLRASNASGNQLAECPNAAYSICGCLLYDFRTRSTKRPAGGLCKIGDRGFRRDE
jgi:hypothetical protein